HAQTLALTGFARTPNYPSAALLDFITLYAPARDVQKLLGIAGANGALVKVNDFAQVESAARDVRRLLDRRGLSHDNGLIRDPLNFPGKREIDALVLLLSVFSGVGLITSGILVANTLAAITAEQVGEIGTMKAIGGTRWQVMSVYLASALIYGIVGTAFGLAAGTGIAWLLVGRIASLLNLDSTLAASPLALGTGAGLGILVTLLGGAIPALAATNIPVKEALEAYGITSTFGRGLIDRAVSRLVALPPLVAMSIRNLARRKGRSLITGIIIAVAVATSLAAQSVSASVQNALDELFETYHADAWVWMGEWVSSNFDGTLRGASDVTRVETWSLDDAWVSTDANGLVPRRIVKARLWGLPADTRLYVPRLVAGRWYRADEGDAVVISTDLAQSMELRLGDSIRLASGPGAQTFRVIGVSVDNSVFLGSTVAGKVFLRDDIVASMQNREGWAIF
ncbi:MAG TPA: ABC transporter permease, partial [Xanthobacteraceae bacterium]|nr:ABC transporter permease [Xanthobacteraceae bacterium]